MTAQREPIARYPSEDEPMIDHAERLVRASERQTHRIWLEDGLDELMGSGLALTAVGALIALRISPLFFPIFMLIFGLGALAQLWLFARLKARIADPRTGYFRPRMLAPGRYITRLSPRAARLIVVGLGLAGGMIPLVDANLPGPALSTLIWWATMVGSVVYSVVVTRRTGLRRLYLYAIVPLAAIVGRLAGLDAGLLMMAYLGGYGLIALVGGTLALRSYLRGHPRPAAP